MLGCHERPLLLGPGIPLGVREVIFLCRPHGSAGRALRTPVPLEVRTRGRRFRTCTVPGNADPAVRPGYSGASASRQIAVPGEFRPRSPLLAATRSGGAGRAGPARRHVAPGAPRRTPRPQGGGRAPPRVGALWGKGAGGAASTFASSAAAGGGAERGGRGRQPSLASLHGGAGGRASAGSGLRRAAAAAGDAGELGGLPGAAGARRGAALGRRRRPRRAALRARALPAGRAARRLRALPLPRLLPRRHPVRLQVGARLRRRDGGREPSGGRGEEVGGVSGVGKEGWRAAVW